MERRENIDKAGAAVDIIPAPGEIGLPHAGSFANAVIEDATPCLAATYRRTDGATSQAVQDISWLFAGGRISPLA